MACNYFQSLAPCVDDSDKVRVSFRNILERYYGQPTKPNQSIVEALAFIAFSDCLENLIRSRKNYLFGFGFTQSATAITTNSFAGFINDPHFKKTYTYKNCQEILKSSGKARITVDINGIVHSPPKDVDFDQYKSLDELKKSGKIKAIFEAVQTFIVAKFTGSSAPEYTPAKRSDTMTHLNESFIPNSGYFLGIKFWPNDGVSTARAIFTNRIAPRAVFSYLQLVEDL